MRNSESIVQSLNRGQWVAVIAAVVGIVLSLVGAAADLDHFFQMYLVVYLFWVEIALGCFAFLMVNNLLNARWSVSIQRLMAAGARTLPLMAVLFIPILIGMGRIFPWVEDVDSQNGYLNPAFFIVRAVIYFAIWIGLSYMISDASYQSDAGKDEALADRTRRLSMIGLILYFLTASFAAVDWSMSLLPGWFSSVYGWLSIGRQGLATLALAIVLLAFVWNRKPLSEFIIPRAVGDLGALLLAALLGWIYLSYMQYFIIWSANLSGKVTWFEPRTAGSWAVFVTFLTLLNAIPLVLLIIPGVKRLRSALVAIAAVLLAARFVEQIWVVMPTYQAEYAVRWWDFALLLAVSGLWVVMFLWSLNRHSLLPVNHPYLEAMASHDEEENNETARSTS